MDYSNLNKMTREQLLKLAGTQGIKIHPRAKEETIIKHIIENSVTPQTKPQMQHEAQKPQAPVDHNTPEDVEAAIAKIKERAPQFESSYNTQDNTWHFRCKGAEECGNLDIPLRVIVMKANTISRGRLVPMGLNQHFDQLPVSGKNGYTNTVLAG